VRWTAFWLSEWLEREHMASLKPFSFSSSSRLSTLGQSQLAETQRTDAADHEGAGHQEETGRFRVDVGVLSRNG
jgi:hypothetical protein